MMLPGFLYPLTKDILRLLRRRKLTSSEVLERRQKWKPLFEAMVWKNYNENLRSDIIIRDMRRFDNYPDLEEHKGISPWFRVGLVDTYHKGFLVGLGWRTLTRASNIEQWRFTNLAAKEEGGIKVLLIGSIPYEQVENVDWDGDEFYQFPHVYCNFRYNKEPYEKLAFYSQDTPPNTRPLYREVAEYDRVRRLSKKLKINGIM